MYGYNTAQGPPPPVDYGYRHGGDPVQLHHQGRPPQDGSNSPNGWQGQGPANTYRAMNNSAENVYPFQSQSYAAGQPQTEPARVTGNYATGFPQMQQQQQQQPSQRVVQQQYLNHGNPVWRDDGQAGLLLDQNSNRPLVGAASHTNSYGSSSGPVSNGGIYAQATYPYASSASNLPSLSPATPRQSDGTDERRQNRLRTAPSLPVLNTPSTASGFGTLFQQLEVEIDQIQARHSPASSPTVSASNSFSNNISLAPQSTWANNSLHPLARRNDSGTTIREESEADHGAYGGSGIISMYDARVPSPSPEDNNIRFQGAPAITSSYQGHPSTSQHRAQSTDERTAKPSQMNNSIASQRTNRKGQPDSHNQPSFQSVTPNSSYDTPAALSHNSFPSSQGSTSRSARPLPSSSSIASRESTGLSTSSRSSAGLSMRSTRAPRQSQESNLSNSSSYAPFPSGPSNGSGISAPRPSLSSSNGSRPSLNYGDSLYSRSSVRPLPVPEAGIEQRENLLPGGYVPSPEALSDVQPTSRERARSEFARSASARQSDFRHDFYSAGSQQTSAVDPAVKRAQSNRHPIANRYAVQPQPPPSRQYATLDEREHRSLPTAILSQYPDGPSPDSHFSTSPTPITNIQHPSIHHSYSDPAGGGRASTSSSRPNMDGPSRQGVSLSSLRAPSTSSSTSRSASFSSSATPTHSEHNNRRNASLGHHQMPSGRNPQANPRTYSQQTPDLPSSPSISISPSMHDNSMTSMYSAMSTAPSTSTYASAMRKQASLSPSNMSLSAQGFFSSRRPGTSERERQRLEGLGLQHLNPALLSNLAVAFKDRIARTVNVKGAVPYPSSFTGEQIVSCLAEILPFPYTDDRRIAITIARTLHRNMFFNEVDWDDAQRLRDSQEQVYCFQDDEEQATMDYLSGNAAGLGVYSPSERAPAVTTSAQEIPNGVITRFTKCYSPFCGMEGTSGSGACYSLYCPNGAHPLGLQRKQSSISLAPSGEETAPIDAWANTVPPEIIEQLGPREVARQNVIYEIITGEQAYKKDLDMLETAYAEPIRSADPPIIEPSRLPGFANHVFANLDELRSHSSRLIKAFQVRQREQSPVIDSIGDLLLDAALEWGQAYIDFTEAQVLGEYLVNEEKSKNSAFATFLQSRREAFGIKQDFRHYHLRATIRLQRYLLPLAEYIKRCPDDHPDRETTQEAMRIIKEQCDACNTAVAAAQLRLACQRYDRLIEKDFSYANEMDLLNPARQLFHHGKMYAKPEGARSEWTEYQIMLFDHYLAISKPRRTAEGYRLIRKPIRVEMFSASGWDDPPVIRSLGFHLGNVIRTGDRREASSNGTSERTESKMWPIAFRIIGRSSGTLTLFVESAKNDKEGQARREWKARVEQAIAARKAVLDANEVFHLRLLVDPDTRRATPTTGLGVASLGKVLTSCPFIGPTGQRLIAVGTSTGLHIALKRDPSSLRQILQISTQYCAVLQDFGMFLVHTEGRLLAYLLETLVQTSSGDLKGQQGPQQVSGQKEILFFKVGRVGLRTLVVYAKKDGVNSTVLKAMEPVANIERSRVQHSRFLGMGGKKTEWFRLFKDAAVPTEVYSLSFTRSKLALVCAPGFEILDIDTLKTGSFPDWTSLKSDPAKFDAPMALLQRRCYESRAIGLFRISDSEFLFCYEDFAFFADRHGDPVRERFGEMIEWEGRPDTVVYCKPYVLAFDTRFIEVRDTSQRGKLVQILRGTNIRCTYDGQGLPSAELEVRHGGSVEADERLPHFVMRENNVEKLYELVPRY